MFENTLESLRPIMQRHAVRGTPEEFQSAVNLAFHRFEAEVYDDIHQDMWHSLPRQFALLAGDCLDAARNLGSRLTVLDVGCGTGLASEFLLQTELGRRVEAIDLLDTTPQMLARAARRAQAWPVRTSTVEGRIDAVLGRKPYDLVLACSVLHHIPDLAGFLRAVRPLQAPHGLFLHLQDPNGDYLEDRELRERMAEGSRRRLPDWAARLTPRRIGGRLYRQLTGQQGNDYIFKANQELLASGVIDSPLTIGELFTITDIHIQDEQGISIRQMARWLPDYRPVSRRSYGFFGCLWSELPARLKKREEELISRGAPNGFHVGAAWALEAAA